MAGSTLLIHANDHHADYLDTIFTRYEARGYRFVALDDAMRDPDPPKWVMDLYGGR